MTSDDEIGSTVADRSLRIVTALSAEVVVLRERLAAVEQVALARGLFGPEDVDGWQPDAATAAAFKAERQGFLKRVFGAMRV